MKECPECKRTYADETLTFCLADGALLSAPFDPSELTQARLLRPQPLRTEVIPAHLLPAQPGQLKSSPHLKYMLIGLLCLLAGGGVVAFLMSGNKEASRSANPTISPAPSNSAQATKNNTPDAAMKAFYEAAKNKDVQGMKSVLSRKMLAELEKAAQAQNKSLDDYVRDSNETGPPPATLETRNEKIDGETATLEISNGKGEWETVNFAKEDGQWKVTMLSTSLAPPTP